MSDMDEVKFLLDNRQKILEVLGHTKGRLEQSYRLMNAWSEGKLKNYYGGGLADDPTTILMEVYMILAPIPAMVRELEDKFIENTKQKEKPKVIYS